MPVPVTTETNPPTSPSATHRRASLKVLSRNIDKVALGNLIFPTWYYSPYPDNIIHGHDSSTNAVKSELVGHGGGFVRHDDKHETSNRQGVVNGIVKHDMANAGLHLDRPALIHEKSIVGMLHVCPYCFRYTRSPHDFAGHLAIHVEAESSFHSRRSNVKQQRKSRRRRSFSTPSSQHGYNGGDHDGGPRPVPDSAIKVYSHEGYTVWDVDGEVEKLYCQNLSLFGKLFLESKSVFFDTAGFHYFVLTYCSPSSTPSPPTSGRKRRKSNSITTAASPSSTNPQRTTTHPTLDEPSFPLQHQVLGFFSKENLSWDSNNLACILVFPPYQHRNLGQLLMAVSYKLSGWEWEDSIIGGPEKPLSTMGRKSYLRFWSERVARFIMGQSQDAEGLRVFEEGVMQETQNEDGDVEQVMTGKKRKRKHGRGFVKDELSVKELGDRTGMLCEDVVAALVEMGVCDVVIPSSSSSSSKKKKQQPDIPSTLTTENNTNIATTVVATKTSAPTSPTTGNQQHNIMSVTVSRSKVLEWARKHRIDMVSSVKEEGFLGEWALSEEDSEDEAETSDGDGGDDGEQGSDETDDSN